VSRIDKREKRVDPANWAGLKPFGIGQQKPNNYRELWRAFRENRDNAAYAWRILTQGTCDGCSLGHDGDARLDAGSLTRWSAASRPRWPCESGSSRQRNRDGVRAGPSGRRPAAQEGDPQTERQRRRGGNRGQGRHGRGQ
jgi:hypothetical protein